MNESPSVSVVLAAADAARLLPGALEAIASQDYPNINEVVVAAADTATASVAAVAGVRVIDNPTGVTPAGLNLAIGASSGEVIVRVDAQSRIPSSYVSTAVRTLLATKAENVGGIQAPIGTSFWQRAIAAAMSSPAGAGDARYRLGGQPGPVDTVYLGTFRKSTLVSLGGYSERFVRHQDYELNERIRKAGGTVWFDPEMVVEYRPRASLAALGRQYFGYGTWKRFFARTHPGSLRSRHLAPPVLVTVLAISFLLSFLWIQALWIPGLYVIGLVAAGLSTLPRSGMSALAVPLALATMHLSWGTGFLVGQSRSL